MLTRKAFTKEFDGASSSYSSYLVMNTTIDDILKFINGYDEDACALGAVEEDGNVSFQIFGEMPDLIYDITRDLKTRGYADVDWDVTYFAAAENGDDYEDFTAEFVDGAPEYRDDNCWDSFVDVTDPNGTVFHTGAGAVDDETMIYFKDIVNAH